MRTTVHILATVLSPHLLDATRLVFQTLRKGFPAAHVVVNGNGLDYRGASEVQAMCKLADATYMHGIYRSHDAWIEELLLLKTEPFWICDTDLIFFEQVEGREPAGAILAGELEPEFLEEWTASRHMERLHTCLMYFEPVPLRCKMRQWMSRIPLPWGASAQMNLVRQMFIPSRLGNETLFYDTCAGLWQVGIGTPFSEELKEAYAHLHCGTYADRVSGETESLRDLERVHREVYENPERARWLREKQAAYYESRAVPPPERGTVEVVVKG